MNQPINILVLEDNKTDVEFIKNELNKSGMKFFLKSINTKEDFILSIDEYNADVILSNHSCKKINSEEALELIKSKKLIIPFILVTDSVNEEFAVKMIKLGADDYIVKNNPSRLHSAIENALKSKQQELDFAKSTEGAKKQQKRLQQNLTLMETAIRVSKIGYWSWDILKDEVFWSTKMFEIYDINTETSLKYNTVLSCIHPDDQQLHNDYVEDQIKNKTNKTFQYRIVKQDKTICYVEVELEVIINKKNEAIKLQGTVVDITEEREREEALKNSESKFRSLTSSAPVGIYQSNAVGENSFVNEELMRITGMTFEEATGIGWASALHPDDAERVVQEWQASIVSGEDFVSEYRINDKKGKTTWVSAKAVARVDSNGETYGFIGIVIDISKRKEAEEKLILSENLNKAIFDSKVIGFFYFDANGEIIDANEFFLDTFGYSKQDLLDGKLHWGKMTPPEFSDRDQLALKELAETGICLPFEKKFICKDGSHLPILIGGGMLQEENTTKGFAYILDITERKKNEEVLQKTLNKLEDAQEISKLGYWEFDLVTFERIWSKQVFKNYNFQISSELPTTEELIQHTHPDDRDILIEAVEKAWKGIQTENFIIRTNPEHGPQLYLLNIWQLIYNEDGIAQKLLGTVQDITNEKVNEIKLIEQNEALKKANTELDRFVYSASHDLRAPLKSMLGLTDLLQFELKPDEIEQNTLIDMIKKSALKLDDFIEDILDYSRNARIKLNLEKLNFEEIIEEIKGNHKFMDGAKDVFLKIDIQLETTFISDLGRVKIILNNLISNAVKYHDNKNNDSFVVIKIRCNQTNAMIEIADNGIGIAQKEHEDIFKMFHRATILSTGSGLGLYIVSEALEKLGGNIKLESELGNGSKFTLTIPNNH